MGDQTNQTSHGQPSEATRKRLEAQLADPNVSDHQNAAFLFSLTSVDLLLAIASGLLDPILTARQELTNRGLDANGKWVGFESAAQTWGVER